LPLRPITHSDRDFLHQRRQTRQFLKFELTIGIGEGHPLEPGCGETRSQRRPISAIHIMPQQPGMSCHGQDSQHLRNGVIGAAIVDNDNFIVSKVNAQSLFRLANRSGNRLLFIKGGNDQAQSGATADIHARSPLRMVKLGKRNILRNFS
jgi:hypothetical protein